MGLAALAAAAALLLAQACTNTDVVGVVVGDITVTPADFTLLEGEDQQFRALVVDGDGEPIPRASVAWASDHPEILSIDGEGMAQAVAPGTAVVTATFRGVEGTATVTVSPAPAIAVSDSSVTIRGAAGAQSPADVVIDVTNGGGGALGGLSATVAFGTDQPGGWLTATLAADQANTTLTLTTQTQTLPLGVYDATVSIVSPDDDDGPFVIPVTLTLTSFTIVESDGTTVVDEAGSSDDFEVVLDVAPESDVVLSITSANLDEVTVAPAELTFTPDDWDQPRTVTVTGQQDEAADGDRPTDVIVAVVDSVSDDAFDPIPDRAVAVTVQDDDAAAIGLTPTSGLVTSEGGGQDGFTVVLGAQPTSDVTIGLSSSDPGEGLVSPSSLTFTSSDWSTPQAVTVTGVNDEIDDGDVAYAIVTAPAVSADPAFDGLDAVDVGVTNTDDGDAAGITVSPTGGLLTTESGGQATFTLVLNSQPIADVVIGLTSGDPSEGTVTPASVTFTETNWSIARTITVASEDDALPDGDIVYDVVTSAAISADPSYDGLDPSDVSVTNVDDETAGITVTPASGPTTEAGGQATFTIVLNNQPAADVMIGVTSSDVGEGTISTASLTFTSSDWASPQPVTVTGVDDDLDDGDIVYTIVTAPATSTDPNYNGIDAPDVSLANVDDDVAGFLVSSPDGPTTESGGVATFTVRLTSQPLASVSLTLTSSDLSEGTVSPASLTFTTADWSTPQTVTVTGVDDDVADGNIGYSILTGAATSADGQYSGRDAADVSITNIDDETAGITVSAPSGPTTEAGGAATFSVVLNTEPLATVTIGLSSSDPTEGTISTPSLTFTPGNWDVAQTVTVTGVDDDFDDGDIAYSVVTAPAASGDPDYVIDAVDVSLTNVDDDIAGFEVTAPSRPTTEAGGQATFTVRLTSQPTASVTIPLSSSDQTEGTVNPTSLTFTGSNWSAPRLVTVTGRNDDLPDGNVEYAILLGVASSGDPGYAGLNPPDVALTNVDDETAGITVSPVSGPTTEAGGEATFTVVLNAEPTADVTIGLSSNDQTEGTVDPIILTFTASDWSTPQAVTITGVDDSIDDDNVVYTIVTAPAASTDSSYDGLNVADVTVTNVDDDTAGFTVSAASGPTTEAGGQGTFTMRLTSQPTADVTVALSSSDTSEGTVDATSLTFTPTDWDNPQIVTVTGVNDPVADGNIGYTIVTSAATSMDSRYSGLDPADVPFTNVDNETVGVTVSPVSGPTTEAGGQATFTVVLNTQPVGEVTIGLSSSNTAEGTVDRTSVTFTQANWGTPQTVTVMGEDDDVDDGNVMFTVVTAPASSTDPAYNGLNPPDVSVTNVDDDNAGFSVVGPSGPTTEGGGEATFTIALTSEPTANVFIGLSSSDTSEGTVSPAGLTFTPGDWSAPKTVTVTGQDDDIDDDLTVFAIETAPALSDDPVYNGRNPPDVFITNVDDADQAGISVAPTSGLVTTEAGGTATFTVVLDSEPVAAVTIALSSSDETEGRPSPGSVSFTPADWDSPRTVTVTGENDDIDDESVAYTIVTEPATSTDPNYAGMNAANVSLTNLDDADEAGIVVAPTSGLETTEAMGTAQFTIRLTSEPTANVRIDLSSSDPTEGSVLPTSVTLTSVNWDVPQAVVVTGVDDFVDDGDIGYTIVTSAAFSADPNYDGRPVADVTVSNRDDDTAGIDVSPTTGLVTTEGGGGDQFTVVLTSEPTATVTVALSSSDPGEGTPGTTSLVFNSTNWSTVRTVNVTGVDDAIDDGDVDYSIILSEAVSSDPDYGGIDPPNVSVTNTDDDAATVTVSDRTVAEGTGGTTIANFAVTLNVPSTQTVTVDYATAPVTATTPADYTATSGTVTFSPGDTSEQISVTVQGDALDENDETFTVTLSNPSNATIADGDAVGTITDDDPEPTISIGDATVTEGNAGTTDAVFTVTMSTASGRTVTVLYATANGSAVAPGDYTPTSGTLTFDPGVTSLQVVVPVVGDTEAESDETFQVDLSNPTNADLGLADGLGTIRDDDDEDEDGGLSLASLDASATDGGTDLAPYIMVPREDGAPDGNFLTGAVRRSDAAPWTRRFLQNERGFAREATAGQD